ncbi:probable E3 ubiquitin-protein ligase ARI8 isoform X2 [Haplochromis burtoni]|uniref:probable E3 ubiquitin-protein ligase ARI8 isoform X2 n=1 Tax=Haplochromis burtoni TaxID=8153 RepID=UPI0003BCB10E|nr:probable E3 ubiquitin-protein ligase ARI8 isoform X2 [Haplochromis burtoni]XP_042078173.1 probable E3 ubiquitin-protein ligase ARI8 isoform X2 [Haplochromis burtoni]
MGLKLSKKKKISHQRSRTPSQDSRSSLTYEEEKCYDPSDSTLTFVDGDDELDFLYEDFKSLRALMSCGHAVTPMSLTNWCLSLLNQGESRFVCGQTECHAEWSFEEVCKMALLTPEEIEYFEKKMFSNSKDVFDVKSCPGCKSSVLRTDFSNLSTECTVCTADLNRTFTFCWQCLREWKGPSPRSNRCENHGCNNKSLETLRKCPDITFQNVEGITGCPSIRACPTCGFLVEHNTTGCKNIFCTRCKLQFCFVCLKMKEECLETSEYYKPCSSGVAPRQTSIPVCQWDDY